MGGERPAAKTAMLDEEREGSGITIEVLQQHFHQPLVTVAEELGVSLTMIKRLCRKLGMPRWPYRQIDSINKSMEDLNDQLEGARTEADRERYCKQLEDAYKKKRLITRGAAAGVDPNVRNALYLADTADVSEEDIFGNPELMPKLSAALKTITKRKRVKGKPLVDLIATVQRDGSLPACVQSGGGQSPGSSVTAASTPMPASLSRGRSSSGTRRPARPPALVDAIATSNEEYAANLEQVYGNIQGPGSSTSGSTSVSPALSGLGTSNSSTEEYARHGWGHNSGGFGSQQYGGQGTPGNSRSVTGAVAASSVGGADGYLQDTVLDSPASSCSTLVAGSSPGGSISGGLSPAAKSSMTPLHLQQVKTETAGMLGGGMPSAFTAPVMQLPSSARSTGGGNHWGQRQASPAGTVGQGQSRPQKRLSATSSAASTDVESLDTSHLLDFDDDDDDEGVQYGSQPYGGAEAGGSDGYSYPPAAGGGGGGGGGGGQRVSPEDLQELEDALLMDSFGGVMDEPLEGEDIPSAFPEISSHSSFPDLQNVGASLPPLPRNGHVVGGGQRATPRSTPAGGAGSPHMLPNSQTFGLSPSHAGSASPVAAAAAAAAAAASATSGFPLAGSNSGPPRPGPRGMGRPRSQVPPRPYTPSKSSRGVSVPWLSHGLAGGISPRVGVSPRPPTPGTPGGARMAPSPNGRRRGDEAFPEHFALPSPNDPSGNGLGGPSPKARRVGARAFPARFPGSPQAGLSPRVGFPQHSPRGGGAVSGFSVGACPPLDGGGSDRTYFPAPAASAAAAAAAAAAGFTTLSPANGTSRGHRRSNSSGWGSAPRHGGAGEGGLDAAVAGAGTGAVAGGGAGAGAGVGSNMGLSMQVPNSSQNWSMRLGEKVKTSVPATSVPGRHSWDISSSGEMPTASHSATSSASGQTTMAGGNLCTPQHSTGDQQTLSTSTARVNHGHGVVRRRHSSPIPPLPTFPVTPAAAEWNGGELTGGDLAGSTVQLKTELAPDTVATPGVSSSSVIESFSPSVSSSAGTSWTPPPPPPSPMPEKDAWWSAGTERHQAAAAGREASAAAVAVVAAAAAAAVPSTGRSLSAFSDSLDGIHAQITSGTNPVDL